MTNSILRLTLSVSLVLVFGVPQAVRADDAVPLSHFEQQVDASLALQAAQAGIEADRAALASIRDRGGLQLTAIGSVGPRRDIVNTGDARNFTMYDQTVGVRIPMLGTRASERESEIVAKLQQQVAEFEFMALHTQLMSKLRQNYITYWSAREVEKTAQAMLEELRGETAATGALQRNGFWTSADALRYNDLIARARTDQLRAQSQQRQALDQLTFLTSTVVQPFEPVKPDYAACDPVESFALASSYKSDPELAKLAVQQDAMNALLPLQRQMGMDGGLLVGARGYYEQPGGTGFGGFVGFDVSMPLHDSSVRNADTQHVSAQLRQYTLLAQARRQEIQTGVAVAFADRFQAVKTLAQAQLDHQALAEDLRESQVRFVNVSPDSLAEVQHKLQLAYEAQLAIVNDEATVLQNTRQVLQFAPDACTAVSAMNSKKAGTP
jgi:outer membrane protein TolC